MDPDLYDDNYDDLPLINIFDARIDAIVKETQEINKKSLKELEEEIKKENPSDIVDANVFKSLKELEEEKKKENPSDIVDANVFKKKEKERPKRSCRSRKRSMDDPDPGADDGVKLSKEAKKRLRAAEWLIAHDSRRFELQNKLLFDKMDEQDRKEKEMKVPVLELSNRNMLLKISYNGSIQRLQVKLRDKFQYIFPKVAFMFGLEVKSILLCLGERNIKLEDTPESLDIQILDIIDCLPYRGELKKGGYYMMLLKFQSNDFRRRTEFYVHQLEKFSEIKKTYAALRELNVDDIISLKFDDETIDLENNPLDLEMESGYVVDVTVKKEKPITNSSDSEESVQEIPPPIPMMTVIDLD